MKNTKIIAIALAVTLTAAAVPAVSAASDRLIITQATGSTTSSTASQTSVSTSSIKASDIMSLDKAMEVALKEVPGVLKSIEFDVEDFRCVDYQAEVHYESLAYELEFSVTDGTIYENKKERIEREDSIPAGSYITFAQARDAAVKEVPGGFVSKLELQDAYNLGVVYEAQVWLGDYEYDIVIDADDGTILRNNYERDSDAAYYNKYLSGSPVSTTPQAPSTSARPSAPSTSTSTSSTTQITREQAEKIALEQVSDGFITDIEYDRDHARTVYEVEVRSGNWEYSFDIDASTGDIIKTERDYEDDWYDFD